MSLLYFGFTWSEAMSRPYEDQWRRRAGSSPFSAAVTLGDDALVLGRGTILRSLGDESSNAITIRTDAQHDRMVALLATAAHGSLSKHALLQLEAALSDWRRGDRGLAAIRLAFARLPRLQGDDDAYRLFLAETALDAGLAPNDFLRHLGYAACAPLLKFNPYQPRVPSGSGPTSGRWTSGDAGGTAAAKPQSGPEQTPRPIPVFLPSEPYDPDGADAPDFEESERRFGLPDFDTERSGQRLHFPEVFGIPSSPASPGRAPSTSPAPGSQPGPLPGGLGPAPPDGKQKDDTSPACPTAQNDRPNGLNPSGDEFEYQMSLLINPNNPTPKNSAATPNVTSQAYYLPSPTPDGKTSFDDCEQDDTPTVLNIPNLEPGDMFEMKASGWDGLLSNSNTKGYQTFEKQIESQSDAVLAEGRGRQIYYCMGSQSAANLASNAFGKYPNSHFLVCH